MTDVASGAVEARVRTLREQARSAPDAASDDAWEWFLDLKQQSRSDLASADAELNELFRLGTVPEGLDGPTEGILITTTTNPVLDPAVRAITALWMPWQGKRFDAEAASGDNRMAQSSRLPVKLLWPFYKMADVADGKLAFDFKTYADAGKDDPDIQVLVIDYADVADNPAFVIRSIRDELVQIVPGAFLGKILFRRPRSERYDKIGYFALRTP
jgi:hypothetical protein